jgi:hypothetical protein
VTHSIVQAPLQSELYPVFKLTSQDQKTPFWSSFNRHPVSLISLAASLYFSSSPFHPSCFISHLFLSVHLLLVYIGGSAAMPSHIQRGPSVVIPSVQRPKLSHQRLHPHIRVQVRQTLSEALHNNRDGRHFYPIYVHNPKFGKWDLEPKMVIATYIKYSLDYTSVMGSMGQGQEERTLPVQVGCRAQYYAAMMTAMWRDLERGSSKEFAVNDCLADIGDTCIIGKVNRFRGYAELRQTLNGYLLDAQKEVTKVTKELLKVEEQLEQSRN